jgi:hypothetical protein
MAVFVRPSPASRMMRAQRQPLRRPVSPHQSFELTTLDIR